MFIHKYLCIPVCIYVPLISYISYCTTIPGKYFYYLVNAYLHSSFLLRYYIHSMDLFVENILLKWDLFEKLSFFNGMYVLYSRMYT